MIQKEGGQIQKGDGQIQKPLDPKTVIPHSNLENNDFSSFYVFKLF